MGNLECGNLLPLCIFNLAFLLRTADWQKGKGCGLLWQLAVGDFPGNLLA